MRLTLSANIWFQWEDVNVWANVLYVPLFVYLIIKAKRIWRLQSFYPVEFGRKSAFFHVIFESPGFLERISTGVIVTFSMEWLYLMKWSYKKFLYLRLEWFRILNEWLRKRPFRLCDVSPTYWAPQPLRRSCEPSISWKWLSLAVNVFCERGSILVGRNLRFAWAPYTPKQGVCTVCFFKKLSFDELYFW